MCFQPNSFGFREIERNGGFLYDFASHTGGRRMLAKSAHICSLILIFGYLLNLFWCINVACVLRREFVFLSRAQSHPEYVGFIKHFCHKARK